MKKCNGILFIFLTALLSQFCHASNDIGYKIKYESFSLTIRFTMEETDIQNENFDFLYNPAQLFFSSLQWVYCNKDQLNKSNLNIVSMFYPEKNTFQIWDESDVNKVKKIMNKKGNADSLLFNSINNFYKLKITGNCERDTIGMFLVSSRDLIEDQIKLSDVYFGSLPRYMYNYEKKIYYNLFWNIQKVEKMLFENVDREFICKKVYLSKNNVQNIVNFQ